MSLRVIRLGSAMGSGSAGTIGHARIGHVRQTRRRDMSPGVTPRRPKCVNGLRLGLWRAAAARVQLTHVGWVVYWIIDRARDISMSQALDEQRVA